MTLALASCRLVAVAAVAASLAAPAAAADADGDADGDAWLDAWLLSSEGYRLRMAQDGGSADQDARLLVDGGARVLDGAVGIDVSGALFWDIDGESRGFASVHDAHGPLDVFIDTLELRATRGPWLDRASAGRITVVEGWPMTLDGAAVAVRPVRNETSSWVVFASAGRTVHFFDADEGTFENWAASIGTELVLGDGLELQVDYRALVETSRSRPLQHSYGVSFFRRVDDALVLQLYGRGIDDEISHVGGRAHVAWTPWRIGLDLDAAEQVVRLGEVFEGQDPYFAILGASDPHLRGSADAWGRIDIGILDAGVHLGGAGKRLLVGDQGPFNRDSARVYAAVDVADVAADLLAPGFFASLTLSHDFAVAPTQDSVTALGGSAGYSSELFRCAVGTSWDRTKYTYYRDVNELTDVRTVFASAELRVLRSLRVKADYTLELAGRVLHTGQVTLSHELGGTW